MAIKVTVDTASELLWIKTTIEQGVLNCEGIMKFLNKEYDMPLVPHTITYEHSDKYVIDLAKLEGEK